MADAQRPPCRHYHETVIQAPGPGLQEDTYSRAPRCAKTRQSRGPDGLSARSPKETEPGESGELPCTIGRACYEPGKRAG
jgi:hypothetical protein